MPGALKAVSTLAPFTTFHPVEVALVEPHRCAWQTTWIQRHLGDGPENPFYKKVVFTHRKDLFVGDFLVDDRLTMRGADRSKGELIQFGGAD